MKFRNLLTLAAVATTLTFTSCTKDQNQSQSNALPSKFKVDIPSSISHSGSGSRSAAEDTLSGEEIYEHMGTFIHVGEEGADIVQNIIHGISSNNINGAMSLNFTSDDDGREKSLVAVENVSFEGIDYAMKVTISDIGNASADDEGKALQVFWNTNPVVGVAILKPKNINTNDTGAGEAMFRIDYSEDATSGYDKHMIVSIADLPEVSALVDPYSMSGLKMFVGKKGDHIDVFGNSNHPNARFFSGETGFNWAFAASGEEDKDIAVAEVGLPKSTLESTDRTEILVTNSVKNVLSAQITATWPLLDQSIIDVYLRNTEAPAYFDENGFKAAGTSPSSEYDELETRVDALTPYSPKTISELSLSFQ